MNPDTYQIKITLRDSHPPIWRCIQVRSDLTLRVLNRVIQETMGWENSHLHRFTFKKKDYGWPDPDGELDIKNDSIVHLNKVITGKGQCFIYEYDFGDSWEHYCVVEKVLPFDENKPAALCIAGARACPPEDVGGIPGYEEFLEAVRHPNHQRHKEMLDWAGGAFDSEAFDFNGVNKRLQRVIRRPRKQRAAT